MSKSWVQFGMDDALPCPKCGNKELERFANVIVCEECEHWGPAQEGPEFMCDWRHAVNDWNIKAGGEDFFGRSHELLKSQGLLPDPVEIHS